MKKKAKTPTRSKVKSKLPSALTHQRFGTLRLVGTDEFVTQIQWCGHTIDLCLYVAPDATEESLLQQLDLASILLIDQAGWQLKMEGFIKQALKSGEGEQLFDSLTPQKISKLAKCFEPRTVLCSWKNDHALVLHFKLTCSAPGFEDDHFTWAVNCRIEPRCDFISLDSD